MRVLLHPARIRILTTLAEREATPQEITAAMPGLPKASLYRHLNLLRAVGAIREVREYRVRGVYEKVYAIETDTGPLAGFARPDGRPGACLAEWLSGLAPSPLLGEGRREVSVDTGWERTARLAPADALALQAVIDAWLDKRGRPDDIDAAPITIRIDTAGQPQKERA